MGRHLFCLVNVFNLKMEDKISYIDFLESSLIDRYRIFYVFEILLVNNLVLPFNNKSNNEWQTSG